MTHENDILGERANHNELPQSPVIIAYGAMAFYGLLLGLFIGWVIWA